MDSPYSEAATRLLLYGSPNATLHEPLSDSESRNGFQMNRLRQFVSHSTERNTLVTPWIGECSGRPNSSA